MRATTDLVATECSNTVLSEHRQMQHKPENDSDTACTLIRKVKAHVVYKTLAKSFFQVLFNPVTRNSYLVFERYLAAAIQLLISCSLAHSVRNMLTKSRFTVILIINLLFNDATWNLQHL